MFITPILAKNLICTNLHQICQYTKKEPTLLARSSLTSATKYQKSEW